ncbi:hypothetical protein PFICI_06725 [Pestalotiopsis fici W106-1]|uniref:Uncharacterized protein n=1 Tax=Pestalotiopsis fici (strain W106-1 / CGMCC3.15140) TaxID=1229662 RepID=W3X6K0_PESFW|nr:uncharacterized protein PFICI_06725 [Pestalotiopsis fici W106-1]ETS81723.1 hypothetical protein PFICI_06725 [Pestalotiopsis fici W106-1]
MSARLESIASFQATMAHNFWKQVFTSVPLIPAQLDLAGKTVLVTGSNVGLGLESVRHFLKLRPRLVIMAVRSREKGEAAATSLRPEFPGTAIQVWEIDMASFQSVQAFVARLTRELDGRLHVAVLNAGLSKIRFERAQEGGRHESTLQVNYLGTALLALLLLPTMRPTASSPEPGRLSIVNSEAALPVDLDDPDQGGLLDSLDRPENYDGFSQYSKSKLLVMMFIAKLAEVVSPDEVIVNCTDPGATKGTAFFREVDSWAFKIALHILLGIMGRNMSDAARIYLHSTVVLGKESHGSYTDWMIRAWPTIMYSEKGRRLSEKLWDETLEELKFAKVGDMWKILTEI